MLVLTPALKAHAVKAFGVAADATDAMFRKAIALKLATGKLTAAKLKELTASKATADAVIDRVIQGATDPKPKKKTTPTAPAPKIDQDAIQKGVEAALAGMGLDTKPKGITPESVFSKASSHQIRVKSASESYDHGKKAAYYPERTGFKGNGSPHLLAGKRATHGGIELDHPSQLDKAVAAAFYKWSILNSPEGRMNAPGWARMTDHETDLLQWSMRNMAWSGMLKGTCIEEGAQKLNRQKMNEHQVKALLDDSTSGGIEAAPIAFDDAIILIPVLYGELFPLVNVVNVARGRRMKGAAQSNPSFTSGTAEGTAITPFDTTGFITAFDTTIYPAVAAMELGLDWEEDAPADMGGNVIESYGLKALEYLDRVIAVGTGTTEPTGIFTSTGTTSVNSDSGPGGPLTVSDFEGLMFAMQKQFRNEPGSSPVWLSNDTMYRRCRGIAVGPGDERRVFGMDHGGYTLLDKPYKVQNSIGNGKLAFFNPRRYRMYRRLGLTIRIETLGKTLALANTRMIVLRMRYGGQIETGGAAAIMLDAQA